MGVVPTPPPPGLSREELIEYRDRLMEQQAQLPGAGSSMIWLVILVVLFAWGVMAIWPYMEM